MKRVRFKTTYKNHMSNRMTVIATMPERQSAKSPNFLRSQFVIAKQLTELSSIEEVGKELKFNAFLHITAI